MSDVFSQHPHGLRLRAAEQPETEPETEPEKREGRNGAGSWANTCVRGGAGEERGVKDDGIELCHGKAEC